MSNSNVRLLLFGAGGQLGRRLHASLAELGSLASCGHADVDLNDTDRLLGTVADFQPRVVVNAAAWTDVERAETRELEAYRINAAAPANLADACARSGSLFIHFSTDYVFSGMPGRGWLEDDDPQPINAYGRSKLAGDNAILASGAPHYIFRAGWMYDGTGRCFLTAITDRLARGQVAQVVDDQWGCPTWAAEVAKVATAATKRWLGSPRRATPEYGVYHVASADHTTWFAFAEAIAERHGFDRAASVLAISSARYGGRARRPPWSVLDSGRLNREFGLSLPGWTDQLDACLSGDVVGAG
ncbi:MAG: dTDP-4-dehydrorhamnose reductase [Gemmatimonadota bacterium]